MKIIFFITEGFDITFKIVLIFISQLESFAKTVLTKLNGFPPKACGNDSFYLGFTFLSKIKNDNLSLTVSNSKGSIDIFSILNPPRQINTQYLIFKIFLQKRIILSFIPYSCDFHMSRMQFVIVFYFFEKNVLY